MSKVKKDKPIYLRVRKMMDRETGQIAGCLVPLDWANQQLMRERGYKQGDVIRAVLTQPRNNNFHKLVHQLGTLVKRNIEGFENYTSHEVIKKLQRESGVFCHVSTIDAAPVVSAILTASESVLGEVPTKMLSAVLPEIKTIELTEPESMAFDSMDEGEFRQLWAGICGYLVTRYWPDLSVEQITEMAEMLPQREA